MAENDIDYFIEKVRLGSAQIRTSRGPFGIRGLDEEISL